MCTKDFKSTKAITLIALVVSIVVLLILAGVSIVTLTGDNGLLTRTAGAKNKTKLAEAQEIANLEYAARLIDRHVDEESEEETISNIVSALENSGFTVDYENTSTETITGVRLLDGTTEITTINLTTTGLDAEKILTIDTIMGGATGTRIYYVQIDNMWHEIEELANNSGIEIKKEGKASLDKSNINESDQTITISISGLDDSTTVKKVIEDGGNTTYEEITSQTTFVNGDKIKIIAGSKKLTGVIITVSVTNVTPLEVGVKVILVAPLSTATVSSSLTMTNVRGEIEVIWLNGKTNTRASTANVPNILEGSGMTPVTWSLDDTNHKWEEDSSAKSIWYNYNTTDKQWANVKLSGSYFVWIPRFAYRITYYDANDDIVGFYDGYGLWTADGKTKRTFSGEIVATEFEGKKYIVHNAFLSNANNGGGFTTSNPVAGENGIDGFWVAKYEMSKDNSSRPVSLPEKESWININIGDSYTKSLNYNTTLKSHLMKNSEWGAVAYLAHSKYGLNGEEIRINNYYDDTNKVYRTGQAAKTVDEAATTDTYTYNEVDDSGNPLGPLASTTQNIYGIYDMSGGALEYIAAYNKNYSGKYYTETNYGKNMVDSAKSGSNYISTKYITAYNSNSDNSYLTDIYSVGITGDATKEVYTNTTVNYSKRSWFSDYCSQISGSAPFTVRGGLAISGPSGGLFYSGGNYGNGGTKEPFYSFRVVLVPAAL